MIDKISGNGSYDYQKRNDARKNAAVQAYENTPGTQKAQKRKGTEAGSANLSDAADQKRQGVILDLSLNNDARQNDRKRDKSVVSAWVSALRGMLSSAVAWLKNFWESDQAPDASGGGPESVGVDGDQAAGDAQQDVLADIGELPPLDKVGDVPEYGQEMEDALKSHSLKQIEQLLTENGAKRLAHNSDLLTYYDRKGKLVEIDETEKYRVLFGDKNVLKL